MAKQHSNGVEPTPLEEWQRMRLFGTVKKLKTGRIIRWRPVELIRALQQGKIPENLTSYVAKRVWLGNADDTRSEVEKAIDWQNYLDLMATLGLMDPEPEPLLATGDLLYDELVEIEETVTSPAKAVLPFPGQQGGHVDAGPEGGQVRTDAK
jgi:hypothetical protein